MRSRRARRTRQAVAFTAAAVVVATALAPAGDPALGQAPAPPAMVRLSGMSGGCGSTDVSLAGSLEIVLPKGATVRSTYEVAGGGQTIDLGEESITASAPTHSQVPYDDEIWFGQRWVPAFPFTYLQRTVVTVDGVEVYAQILEATCTADGVPAQITLSESFESGPSEAAVVTTSASREPRFAG